MVKKRVGIIFGGKSTEHEISLQSAKNIIENIDKNRFEVVLLKINKKGQWYINNFNQYPLREKNLEHIAQNLSKDITTILCNTCSQVINADNCQVLSQIDVIFPITHGAIGEDGSLQGMLRMINLPFVGSDVLSSAICMNKDITKRLLRDAGLHVTPFITLTHVNRSSFTFNQIKEKFGLPLFIKPTNQGSSIGVSKVVNESQFVQAIRIAFKFDRKVIIEQGISGREIECAVLGNDFPQASTCGEIILLHKDFYSYNDKCFNEKGAQILIPATLDLEIHNKIRTIAIKAYRALNCAGMARIGIFLTMDNKIIINEINTLPGFTSASIYPKLWQVSGLNYQDLITRLIELAIERHKIDTTLKNSVNN